MSTLSRLILISISTAFIFTGCGTSQKMRQAEREKVSAASGMYCEFISGDVHNDIDVELNLQLGKRCDASKPFTMTNYKNSSENYGVIYCCSLAKKEDKKVETRHFGPPKDELDLDDELDAKKPDAEKKDEKKDDKKDKPVTPKVEPKPAASPAATAPATAPAAPAATAPATAPTTPEAPKPSTSAPKSAPSANSAASSKPASAPAKSAPRLPASEEAPIFGQ